MPAPGLFISWSGETSRCVADCLRKTLPLILRVEPWLSVRDLPLGRPWLLELFDQLNKCDVGILVVTADNFDSPWMQFEAGALCKNFDHSRVFPYLVGIESSQLRGPFSHFQAISADKTSSERLIEAIRALCVPDEMAEAVRERFNAFWPRIEHQVNGGRGEADDKVIPSPPTHSEYQLKVDRLEERIASLTDLMKEVVHSWRPHDSKDTPQKLEPDSALSAFEGGWLNPGSGSHGYARVVNGELHVPYCFGGNDILTAAYTDWERAGSLWFSRFRWFCGTFQGFAFVKLTGPDAMEGKWWLDDDAILRDIPLDDVIRLETLPEGVPTRWERLPTDDVPEWAEAYFRDVESKHA